jgi:hypothetical protein
MSNEPFDVGGVSAGQEGQWPVGKPGSRPDRSGHGSSQRFGIQWERWWLGSVVVASGEDQSLVCVAQTEGLGSEIIGLRRTAIDTGQGALDRAPLGENL